LSEGKRNMTGVLHLERDGKEKKEDTDFFQQLVRGLKGRECCNVCCSG